MKRRGNKSAATGENCVDPGRRGKCPLADRPTEDVIGADGVSGMDILAIAVSRSLLQIAALEVTRSLL